MKIKSVLAKSLAVVMAFSLVGIAPGTSAEAAKKPKLANVTVNVKKTKTVKVKGVKAKKIKKTKWSVKNKKIAKLSKKKKNSVKVKGLKVGKTKLTAKVKVGKKTYSAKCTVKVKGASNNTTNPTPTPSKQSTPNNGGNNGTATPVPDDSGKVSVHPITGQKVDESQTYSITINELNETTMTSELKRPQDADPVVDNLTYPGDGSVSFTSTKNNNSGVSFYINPCTSEDQLEPLPKGDEYLGYKAEPRDMSDYDYIRIDVTSRNEINLRTYNDISVIENDGFPGSCTTETYEAHWNGGPVPEDVYFTGGGDDAGKFISDDQYERRTVFVPIADLIEGIESGAGSGCDFSKLVAIAIAPQSEGVEMTIHSIDFVKVERTKKAESITVTCDKDTVGNGRTAALKAAVAPADVSRRIVTWSSSDESLATVDFQGTILANGSGNNGKTGPCTFTATATDGSGVKGSITINIGSTVQEEVKTQDIDLASTDVTASAEASKDAGAIKFKAGTAGVFVNFKNYLDSKNITLSNYTSLSIDWEVQKDGKAIESWDGMDPVPGNGKLALAPAGSLTGFSDGIDMSYTDSEDTTKDSMFLTGTYTGGTETIYMNSLNPAELATVAGFNLQLMEAIPADCQIVIKKISLVYDAD